MEYQVPQFIEIEDKIFGPLTFRQFIYVAGGVGLCAVFIFTLPILLAIILCLPVGGLAGALAFYKVNGKPLINMLEAGFNFYTNRRLYLWKKVREQELPTIELPSTPPTLATPMGGLSRRKLEELAWSLDVRDPAKVPEAE